MATILIVDDDPGTRQLVSTVLAYAGHQMREATDGAEALALARMEAPDMVIADLMMPTMDGFEFVRQLRQNPPLARLPVVFFTGTYYLESDARTLAQECGVTKIITKPAEPQQILDAVSQSLGVPPATFGPPPAEEFRQKHLGLLLAKLSQKSDTLAPRLDAMIALGLQLASERNPERLLTDFCISARKILGAKYAVIAMPDKRSGTLVCQYAGGMSREAAASLNSPPLPFTPPDRFQSERQPCRMRELSGDPAAVGLPASHPPVHSFLCVPLISPDHVYGWLCLTDKIGAPAFTDVDEGLAQILAAQVGRIYENASLFAELKSSHARLESEVAERKRAQEQLDRLNRELEDRVRERTAELERANQELEAFSYSVSHDLRAPLRAVGGFVRLVLQQHAASLPSEGQHQLDRIRENTTKMGQLIDGLLDFSRFSRHPLKKCEVSLTAIVQQALDQLQAEQKGRQVEISVQDLGFCQADRVLLQQVYANLLSNALKYTRRRESARIEVGSRKKLGQRVYFVKDNGAGFNMEYAQKLFGVFQRLHGADQFEGTGIGLAIAQRIVQRHGGQIWAEAAPEKGATFYFTLHQEKRHD